MSNIPDFEAEPEAVGSRRGAVYDTNNFLGLLPGGFLRKLYDPPDGHLQDKIDTRNVDWLLRDNSNRHIDASLPIDAIAAALRRSVIYISNTPRQVFADIDAAVEEAGMALEDVKKALEGMRGDVDKIQREIGDIVRKAYLLLRQKGYQHYELIV